MDTLLKENIGNFIMRDFMGAGEKMFSYGDIREKGKEAENVLLREFRAKTEPLGFKFADFYMS